MYQYYKEGSAPVIIGEKNIHVSGIKLEMERRGYKYLGAFNTGWDSFTKDYRLIMNSQQMHMFLDSTPYNERAAIERLERQMVALTKKYEKLEKKVHVLEMEH